MTSSIFFFRGVVAVSMDIMMLDIDQCPEKYYVPNAFKDTHKCDDKSSYVSCIFFKSSAIVSVHNLNSLNNLSSESKLIFYYSAFLFSAEVLLRADINVNVNKDMNTLLKTPLHTMTDN